MRIGIMGGSFDPVHNAHLHIAAAAKERAGLSKVLFLPTGSPPHKEGMTAAQQRMDMVRLAVLDLPWAQVSDSEMRREGTIYTVDTLAQLRQMYPQDELYYIVGADALRDMPLWKDAARAMQMCEVIAVSRPKMDDAAFLRAMHDAIKKTGARVQLLMDEGLDISSSAVRALCAEGRGAQGLVPPRVWAYIVREGLYK